MDVLDQHPDSFAIVPLQGILHGEDEIDREPVAVLRHLR
jgi:hypothetical protein